MSDLACTTCWSLMISASFACLASSALFSLCSSDAEKACRCSADAWAWASLRVRLSTLLAFSFSDACLQKHRSGASVDGLGGPEVSEGVDAPHSWALKAASC